MNTLGVMGDTLYAGAFPGLFKSIDYGVNWTPANNGLPNIISEFAIKNDTIFAAGYGMYMSTDYAATWTTINNGLSNTSIQQIIVDHSNIYLGIDGGGVYYFDYGQAVWMPINNGLTSLEVLSLDVDSNRMIAGTRNGAFFSIDFGATWLPVNNLIPLFIRSLIFDGLDIYAGTSDGVYLSTDNGSTWTRKNSGLIATQIIALAYDGSTLIAGTYGGGVFMSNDNGTTWIQKILGITDLFSYSLTSDGTNLFTGTNQGGIFYSNNVGTNWIQVNNGLQQAGIYSLLIHSNVYAGTFAKGIFQSSDTGANWTQPDTSVSNLAFYALASSGTNIYAGTNGGMYRSNNAGNSWSAINNGLNNIIVLSLTTTGTDLFLGAYTHGIFHSPDSGNTWMNIQGVPWSSTWAMASSGANVFAGTEYGFYTSADTGNTFTLDTIGLTNQWIQAITTDNSNVFAGTKGSGVFINSNLITNAGNIPDEKSSLTIYPNPLPHSENYLTIHSSVPLKNAKYRMYNLFGEIIDTGNLANSKVNQIEIKKLSSGIYFIEVIDANRKNTKKVVIY